MKKTIILFLGALAAFSLSSCHTTHELESKHQVESVHEVKPIHIVVDVNVKVDKDLDNYFGDIDAAEEQLEKK